MTRQRRTTAAWVAGKTTLSRFDPIAQLRDSLGAALIRPSAPG